MVIALMAVAGLAIGIPAYSGLWRSWTGPDGDKSWGLGALWIGVGASGAALAGLLPPGEPRNWLTIVGCLLAVFGTGCCFWMPPPFRPRWYRAQYTPLLRRRR